LLGQGLTSKVYLSTDSEGEKVAVKVLDLDKFKAGYERDYFE
jgi:hypothetical protein